MNESNDENKMLARTYLLFEYRSPASFYDYLSRFFRIAASCHCLCWFPIFVLFSRTKTKTAAATLFHQQNPVNETKSNNRQTNFFHTTSAKQRTVHEERSKILCLKAIWWGKTEMDMWRTKKKHIGSKKVCFFGKRQKKSKQTMNWKYTEK